MLARREGAEEGGLRGGGVRGPGAVLGEGVREDVCVVEGEGVSVSFGGQGGAVGWGGWSGGAWVLRRRSCLRRVGCGGERLAGLPSVSNEPIVVAAG